MEYNPQKIESKWQKKWNEAKVYKSKENKAKKKFYGLVEFPYPSGDGLHVGHLRSYTALDVICRKRRMEGYSVLYPIGFDSFGLPTENYAIKKGVKPQDITKENIANFTRQLKSAGFSFDWSRAFSTSDPEYYKWTQWIFLQLFKRGLAYKEKKTINWCPSCKIGLANEEVVNGKCERCGAPVIKKEKEQWILKITKYADRLTEDLKYVDYLDKIKKQQIEWIGRSEGATIKFQISNDKFQISSKSQISNPESYIDVFTTRPDTIFGVTFLVLAPEHEFILNNESRIENYKEIKKYVEKTRKELVLDRTKQDREKTGIELKGLKAINPATQKEIPIYVADYVSMDYGTGAIMAVPAHDERDFEFAEKYGLPVVKVIEPYGKPADGEKCYAGKGRNINSGFLDGLETNKAIQKVIAWLEENHLGKRAVNYHLRDWIFSRQRYWGEPMPLVFCPACKKRVENAKIQMPNAKLKKEFSQGELLNPGWIALPENNLPLKLPEVEDFTPTKEGDSPLAKATDWVNTICPKCGSSAKRETDVMPNWAGSNWYYLRYCDPKNNKELAAKENLEYWMPVDWYNGGMEHTTLHLLYSRFIYKFLYDIGAAPKECGPEPYKKRTSHGMILGEGGIKMSKSKGNVINPDDYIKEYGADTVRLYEMFMGPFDQAIPWDGKGVIGIYRFLNRAWDLGQKIKSGELKAENQNAEFDANDINHQIVKHLHKAIKKISEDIEAMKFNTAISQLMILLNEMEKQASSLSRDIYEKFLILLSPFAPHIAEELWHNLGHQDFIINQAWPEYEPKLIEEEIFTLVIQINGKVRDQIEAKKGISKSQARELALKSEKIQKWLKGKKIKKTIFVKDKLINFVVE